MIHASVLHLSLIHIFYASIKTWKKIGQKLVIFCSNFCPQTTTSCGLTCLFFLFSTILHQNYRLHMFRPWEHIDRLALLCPIAMLCEIQKIPRQRLRITGNVDDTLRCQRHHRGEKRLVTSGARRDVYKRQLLNTFSGRL